MNIYEHTSPYEVRQKIRTGEITGQTSGMCLGYAQANLAVYFALLKPGDTVMIVTTHEGLVDIRNILR